LIISTIRKLLKFPQKIWGNFEKRGEKLDVSLHPVVTLNKRVKWTDQDRGTETSCRKILLSYQ
jgi:hypothetical protein